MRVRVHKARHHHAPARINDFSVASYKRLNLAARADARDSPVAHKHRAILYDGKLPHRRANMWANNLACQRDKLRAIDDGKHKKSGVYSQESKV
jgi:hypothetical protein